jgi:threonine/homoserine/homoserine lactone efflux protein
VALLGLFYISFLIGLTGAMAPGPLLTVTIGESIKRGGGAGPFLALGHSLLEFFLLLLILFGFTKWLRSDTVYGIIALFGGVVLICMAISTIKAIPAYTLKKEPVTKHRGSHPFFLGAIITLSNPYWFIWWFTIGTGYLLFAKDFGLVGVVLFFLGHILSDFAWYSFVSYGVSFGGKSINTRILRIVLFFLCLFILFLAFAFLYKGLKLLFIRP